MRFRSDRIHRAAMTLVEALVVVGILAVLAALVMAALGRVREAARRTVCVSNLHQIHRALMMYSQDYGGVDPVVGGRVRSYSEFGLPPSEERFGDVDFLPMYLPDRSVWRCPNDPKPNPPYPRSYAFCWCDDEKMPLGDPNGRPVGEIASICGDRMALFSDNYHGWGYYEDSTYMIIMRWNGQVHGVYQHVPFRVCYD